MCEFDKIFSVRPQEPEYFLPTRLAGWATLVTSEGGSPKICFPLESYYFCELGAHAKFQNCSTNPSGRNSPFHFCPPKIGFLRGYGGVTEFFSSSLEFSYFCYLGAHAKFQNCSTNPFGRNSPFRLLSAQNQLF